MKDKSQDQERPEVWREAFERRCPACGAGPHTPCRNSSGTLLSQEAGGLAVLHIDRYPYP